MAETKRGICPGCDREYSVTPRGVMRYHWAPRDIRRTQGYDCPGAGKPPTSLTVAPPFADDLAAAESRGRTAGYAEAVQRLRATRDRWINDDNASATALHESLSYQEAADYLESLEEPT